MDVLGKILLESKPIQCSLCKGKLFYVGSGRFMCEKCEHIELDDFGKVKNFLEENGPAPSIQIAEITGVKTEVIDLLLKNGQLEITEGSRYYLQCEKCGCSIRSGRFCHGCAKELANGIKRMFYAEVGEKPKPEYEVKAKVHFFNKDKKS